MNSTEGNHTYIIFLVAYAVVKIENLWNQVKRKISIMHRKEAVMQFIAESNSFSSETA